MNISTYESRIKALEDQLNPPAPEDPEIMSMTITPNKTDVNGNNIQDLINDFINLLGPVDFDPANPTPPSATLSLYFGSAEAANGTYNIMGAPNSTGWVSISDRNTETFYISESEGEPAGGDFVVNVTNMDVTITFGVLNDLENPTKIISGALRFTKNSGGNSND